MYNKECLLDLHTRTHAITAKLLRHCRKFTPEELHRELAGFGYPTLQLQLHHIVDTEAWWIGILQGRHEYYDNSAQYPTIAALEKYRKQVAAQTAQYLAGQGPKALNTPREMTVWKNKLKVLVPALVVLRPVTHAWQHKGQAVAMCRLLGHPVPEGLDLPVAE